MFSADIFSLACMCVCIHTFNFNFFLQYLKIEVFHMNISMSTFSFVKSDLWKHWLVLHSCMAMMSWSRTMTPTPQDLHSHYLPVGIWNCNSWSNEWIGTDMREGSTVASHCTWNKSKNTSRSMPWPKKPCTVWSLPPPPPDLLHCFLAALQICQTHHSSVLGYFLCTSISPQRITWLSS